MKKIIAAVILVCSCLFAQAQQDYIIRKKIIALEGITLRDVLITSFQKDTTFVGDNQLPTSKAVRDFVAARIAGVTGDSATVHKTGNETIAGIKTFTDTIIVNNLPGADSSKKVPNTNWIKQQLYAQKVAGLFPQYSIPVANASGILAATADFTYDNNTSTLAIGYAGYYSQSMINIHGGNGLIAAGGYGMYFNAQGGYPADPSKSYTFYNGAYLYAKYSTTGTVGSFVHWADWYVQKFSVRGLGADSTAPTTSGNVHMLTVDANGLFSHQAIPGGSSAWAGITGKPTTIGGYGITDFNSLGDARWSLLAHTHTFASLTSKPTTLLGYGITDAESYLGVPSTNGYVLSSTTGGTRSWIAAGVGDMLLGSAQLNTGVKTFNNATLLFNNVAGTFNGSFTNTNTANRIYTLKDAAGTLAFTSDITGINSGTNTGDQTTISGNAGTATTLATGRTIGITGDVTYTSPSFDGSANVTALSTVTKINNTLLSGLATGLLKITTSTGVPSTAIAGTDYQAPISLTANKSVVSNGSGGLTTSTTTDAEIGYVAGATSNLQTQINAKATDVNVVHTTGAETVGGVKTLSNNVIHQGNSTQTCTTCYTAFATVTTTQMNAITGLVDGAIVNNTDSAGFCRYNASLAAWFKLVNQSTVQGPVLSYAPTTAILSTRQVALDSLTDLRIASAAAIEKRKYGSRTVAGTDANTTVAAGDVINFTSSTLTLNRNLDLTNISAAGDYFELTVYAQGFNLVVINGILKRYDGSAITTFDIGVPYIFRREADGNIKVKN